MPTEIWTAKEIENKDGKELIIFDVHNKESKMFLRQEERYKEALPLMLATGGYPAAMGFLLMMQPLPWRFTKTDNGQIYLEGKSIGGDASCHPID